MRMAVVGRHERMSAPRAYELGMISQVVDPPEQLRDAAQQLAETIARNSPAAMAATKRALWGALELGLTDACRNGARELVSMWGHPDQEEGHRRGPPVAGVETKRSWRSPGRRQSRPGMWRQRLDEVLDVRLARDRRARPGRLADQQPARSAQRDDRSDARRVRGRVEGARRRSRRARDRAHRQRARVPDRRRRHRDRDRRPGLPALPPVDGGVRPALHRVAPGGVEAGDHRGERDLRGWRVPLGRRRRHRDRGVRRAVLRPARVGRAGRVDRGDRADPQDAVRGGDAHGVRRAPRAHVGATRVRARHDQPDRRPAGAAARRRAGARRDHRPQLPRRDGRDQAGAVGRARARPHRRLPQRRPRARLHVGPPRPGRRPARVRGEARRRCGHRPSTSREREPHREPPRPQVRRRRRPAPHHRPDRHRRRGLARRHASSRRRS